MNGFRECALSAYTRVGAETGVAAASPHRLVLMLFEGARLALANARLQMARDEVAAKGESISRAIAIIDGGLKASLDLPSGGELALHLAALYDYMCGRLLVANANNDPSGLDEVGRLLAELHDAWESIGRPPGIAREIAVPAPVG